MWIPTWSTGKDCPKKQCFLNTRSSKTLPTYCKNERPTPKGSIAYPTSQNPLDSSLPAKTDTLRCGATRASCGEVFVWRGAKALNFGTSLSIGSRREWGTWRKSSKCSTWSRMMSNMTLSLWKGRWPSRGSCRSSPRLARRRSRGRAMTNMSRAKTKRPAGCKWPRK